MCQDYRGKKKSYSNSSSPFDPAKNEQHQIYSSFSLLTLRSLEQSVRLKVRHHNEALSEVCEDSGDLSTYRITNFIPQQNKLPLLFSYTEGKRSPEIYHSAAAATLHVISSASGTCAVWRTADSPVFKLTRVNLLSLMLRAVYIEHTHGSQTYLP